MSDKPNLFVIDSTPLDNMPVESLKDFKKMVLIDGDKPSVALRSLMEKYNCPKVHDMTVIELLRLTYPDLDLGRRGFRFRIVDSAYPNSDPKQFSDEDFDQGIEELLSLPPAEW